MALWTIRVELMTMPDTVTRRLILGALRSRRGLGFSFEIIYN